MKIAIISDTHDNTPAVAWIIHYLNEQNIKVVLHGGDLINPGIPRRFAEHYQGEFHYVFGNNDGERGKVIELAYKNQWKNIFCHHEMMTLELEGKKIFMNHYSAISELVADSGKFDVSIGGHDHVYRVVPHGNCLFINPGHVTTQDDWMLETDKTQGSFVILDLGTMVHERVMVPLN